VRTAEFDFMGLRYRQAETFFFARVDGHDVDFDGFTDVERASVHEYRWWPLADLAASGVTVFPARLPAELALLLADGPPATPREVGR
jgi:hypothetical protein